MEPTALSGTGTASKQRISTRKLENCGPLNQPPTGSAPSHTRAHTHPPASAHLPIACQGQDHCLRGTIYSVKNCVYAQHWRERTEVAVLKPFCYQGCHGS